MAKIDDVDCVLNDNGLYVNSTAYVEVTDSSFSYNAESGSPLFSSVGGTVENCTFNGNNDYGMALLGTSGNSITIEGTSFNNNDDGVAVGGGDDLIFNDCDFKYNDDEGIYAGSTESPADDLVVKNSTFDENDGNAIEFRNWVTDFLVTNNVFDNKTNNGWRDFFAYVWYTNPNLAVTGSVIYNQFLSPDLSLNHIEEEDDDRVDVDFSGLLPICDQCWQLL